MKPNAGPIGARTDWEAWKRLLQQGVAPRVAMQLLGHSQISMTMHYTHVVPELAQDATRRMAQAPWGDTT